jgi:hypothetical protein
MSEELNDTQDVEIEVTDTTEPDIVEIQDDSEPVESQEEAVRAKSFDPKKDKVDFDKPEQQEKFDYIYKQLKMSDKRNAMLTDFLEKQQQKIDDISTRFSQTDEAEAEKVLMNKIRDARDSADDAAYDKAFAELTEFRANRTIEKKIEEKVNGIYKKEAELAHKDARYVANLMEETDNDGNYIRPWLQESNPEFQNALGQLAGIAYKYQDDPDVLQKSLQELDRVMSSRKTQTPPNQRTTLQARTPNPMQGTNLTNQKPKGTIKMTRAELSIAQKLGVDPKRYAARRDSEARKGGK